MILKYLKDIKTLYLSYNCSQRKYKIKYMYVFLFFFNNFYFINRSISKNKDIVSVVITFVCFVIS